MQKYYELFINRRLIAVLLLGFSSGLPFALTHTTLQAWYTVAGVPIITIGVLSLVGQPYVYKFLWAPLMDRFVPPLLGRRRGWILLAQFGLVITIGLMAFMNPAVSPLALAILALVVAFLSASQDISIDAYRTDLLHPNERGMGAAMAAGGYRVAMLVSGGIAMVLAAEIGWRFAYLIMSGLMLAETFVTWWSPEIERIVTPPTTLAKAIVEPFREFMTRKNALLLLVFIVIFKLGDAFTIVLTPTFLLRGLGFSLIDVGTIYKIVGMFSIILGTFIGGAIMTRLDLFRSLLIFGIFQAVSSLSFMVLAMVGKSYTLMIGAVFFEDFSMGLATVALVAFLMRLCDARYTATQYALLSALAAVSRVFVGPAAGVMVKHIGWAHFYLWSFLLAIPGLLLLLWIRNRVDCFNANTRTSTPEANSELPNEVSSR